MEKFRQLPGCFAAVLPCPTTNRTPGMTPEVLFCTQFVCGDNDENVKFSG